MRKAVPVIEMQSTIVAARVQKNREILKSVFKTVIFWKFSLLMLKKFLGGRGCSPRPIWHRSKLGLHPPLEFTRFITCFVEGYGYWFQEQTARRLV